MKSTSFYMAAYIHCSRTPIIRTPIIRNACYPNTTLTKEIRTWQEALERPLRLREKMRPNKRVTNLKQKKMNDYYTATANNIQ